MLLLQQVIYPYLSQHPGVSAIVGDRIYPHVRPDNGRLPAVTFQEVSSVHVESHQGSSGLANTIVQFSAWSRDYREAAQARDAVRLALQGMRAAIGLGEGLEIQGVQWVSGGETFESQTGIYHAWCRLRIWHRVARPGEE